MEKPTYCFLALSISPEKLKKYMLESLSKNFAEDEIRSHNFYVCCQGFSEEDMKTLKEEYPAVNYYFRPKIQGKSISEIRQIIHKEMEQEYRLSQKYDFLVLVDDDFKYGLSSLRQYDSHVDFMNSHPEIGLIACHQHIKTRYRYQIESPTPYDKDLSAISMRNGLIIRNIFSPEELYNPSIQYHEEFWIALTAYRSGFDVYRAWTDVFHVRRSGLGKQLEERPDFNKMVSGKSKAYELGYFDLPEEYVDNPYDHKDLGTVSEACKSEHEENRRKLNEHK